jgi:hypothetical protein
MEQISRRKFLAHGAAVSVVGISGPVAHAAGHAAPLSVENAHLLRLCDEFDAEARVYASALEAKNAALSRYNAIAPAVPEDLVAQPYERHLAECEVDGEYEPVRQPDGTQRLIISSHQCDRDLKVHGWQHNSFRRKAEIAEKYEAAVLAAREESGIDACLTEIYTRGSTLRRLGEEVGAERAETSFGILRKANVAHALATVDQETKCRTVFLFGPDFWAEVVAVLGREAV